MEVRTQEQFNIHQMWSHFGALIQPKNGAENQKLNFLSTKTLYTLLSQYGVLIFRGFQDDEKDFSQWVSNHSEFVTLDPARKSDIPNIAPIEAGDLKMGLHRENASLPYVPDLQWFYCQKEASEGSETTFCDGEAVLSAFSTETFMAFTKQLIRYDRRVSWDRVQRYLAIEYQQEITSIKDDSFDRVHKDQPLHRFERIDHELIHSVRDTYAVLSGISGRLSFCNSILGPSVNYEPPRICWANGLDFSDEILNEVKNVTESLTENLFWNTGDVVLVDNNRIMHGRNRLDDPSRRIFGAQSYLKKGVLK